MSNRTRLSRTLNLVRLESRLAPALVTWVGGNGVTPNSWSNDLNWDTLQKPQAGDTAVFDTSVIACTVDTPQVITGISFTSSWGASFNLATSLTTTGASTWNGGTVGGSGKWTNSGTITVAGNTVGLTSATLTNSGVINHTTGNNLNCVSSPTINIEAGGEWNFASDADVVWLAGSEQIINNKGTIRKTLGSSDTDVRGIINNQGGTWEAQTGTLRLAAEGGALHDGGVFNASAGAVLNVTGGFTATWKGAFTGSGAGTVVFDSGSIAVDLVNGATFNFPAGLFEWNGGTLGGGKLTNTGFINLDGGVATMNTLTLSNVGTIVHKTTNNLNYGSSAAITNETSGVIDFQSDGDFVYAFGGEPTLINKGLIKKSAGGGAVTVQAIISNQGGTWDAQSGTLVMHSDGGAHTGGTFNASAGATLDVTGGSSASWEGVYTGSGAGTVAQLSGTIGVTANGATFNFPGSLYQWNGGTLVGAGTLTNSGTITLNGGIVAANTTTIKNTGTINHVTANVLQLNSGTLFVNEATGVYDFQSDGDIYYAAGGPPSTTNKGTIRKTGGTGESFVDGAKSANGKWECTSGTLTLHALGQTHVDGTFKATAPGAINMTGGSNAGWSGTFTGSGTGLVGLYDSTVIDAGGATFNFPAATPMYWRGGGITGGTLTNTGFITIDAATVGLSGMTLNNKGTISHASINDMQLSNGAQFINQFGAIFDFLSTGDIYYASGGVPTFTNLGLVRKSSAGVSYVDTAVSTPTGVWEVNAGTLQLRAYGQTHTGGTFQAGPLGTIDLTGGSGSNWKGFFTSAGSGVIAINDSVSIDATGATFNFLISAPLRWRSGAISGGTVSNVGFVLIDGGTVTLNGNKLSNQNTIVHTSANDLQLISGADLENLTGAVYDFQSDGDILYAAGGLPSVVNFGLIRKSVGAGQSIVDTAVSNPSGVWEAVSGSIALRAFGLTHTGGTFKATAPAFINMTGGSSAAWQGVFTASGTGTVGIFDSTTMDPAGATFNFPNTTPLHWSGGGINGGPMNNTGVMLIDSNDVTLNATTLNNQGTIVHTTANNFVLGNGATLNNQGVYDFRSDGDVFWSFGGVPLMTNAGVIRKSVGAGTSSITGSFTQLGGTIDVQTGTIALPSTPTFSGVLRGFGTLANSVVNSSGEVAPGNSPGILTISGNYTQSGTGDLRVDLAGTTLGTQYDQLAVNGTVSLGGTLHAALGYQPGVNDTFVIINNDGNSDPVVGTFSNLPTTGSTIVVNGVTLQVNYADGDGNDVTLKVTSVGAVPTPPTATLVVNNSQAQRSMFTTMKVTFSQAVVLGANAFKLTRTGTGGLVGDVDLAVDLSSSTDNQTVAVITFVGPYSSFDSLIDGKYDFRISAADVTGLGGNFDGDGNGTGGDDFFEAGSPTSPHKLYRLFGDINGDGFTDNLDLIVFRSAIGSDSTMVNYNPAFDVNADGFIDNFDLLAFRQRLGVTP